MHLLVLVSTLASTSAFVILLGSELLESGTFDLVCTVTSHELLFNVCLYLL